MAHLIKNRQRNMFYVKHQVVSGRWVRLSTGCTLDQPEEAQAFLEEFERAKATPESTVVITARSTVREFSRAFVEERKRRGILDWLHEDVHFRFHLHELADMPIGNVTKAAALAWARSLATKTGQHGKPLAPATIKKITATVRQLFKEAVKRDIIAVTPCVWDATDLPRKVTSSRSREGGYSAEDAARFIYDERIPEDRRVLYALEFLTGMRTGEAAVRRWRDWEPSFKGELGRIVAATAYNTRFQMEKTTKTDIEKWLPVHPALHELLLAWKREGWARFTERTPTPDDFIVPAAKGGIRGNTGSGKYWTADLVRLGMSHQRHYESRSTFRSLALAGGADEKDLDRLTHPSPKTASDMYTRVGVIWPRLCRAVRAIEIPHRECVYNAHVQRTEIRLVANGPNPPEPQGGEGTPEWRQGRGIEPPWSASQHPTPVLKTGPGTSLGRPAAVPSMTCRRGGQGRNRRQRPRFSKYAKSTRMAAASTRRRSAGSPCGRERAKVSASVKASVARPPHLFSMRPTSRPAPAGPVSTMKVQGWKTGPTMRARSAPPGESRSKRRRRKERRCLTLPIGRPSPPAMSIRSRNHFQGRSARTTSRGAVASPSAISIRKGRRDPRNQRVRKPPAPAEISAACPTWAPVSVNRS